MREEIFLRFLQSGRISLKAHRKDGTGINYWVYRGFEYLNAYFRLNFYVRIDVSGRYEQVEVFNRNPATMPADYSRVGMFARTRLYSDTPLAAELTVFGGPHDVAVNILWDCPILHSLTAPLWRVQALRQHRRHEWQQPRRGA